MRSARQWLRSVGGRVGCHKPNRLSDMSSRPQRCSVDETLAHDDVGARRREAAADLLAADPPVYPREPDWDVVKNALRGRSLDRG